jgi:hypothetical protein
MIWKKILKDICDPDGPVEDLEAYLTEKPIKFIMPDSKIEDRYWLIGPYRVLTQLALDLRTDEDMQEAFDECCFGRRFGDLPPQGEGRPKRGFRKTMDRTKPSPVDPAEIAKRRGRNPDQTPRRGDQYKIFRDFYSRKTLEAHHIVEKSMLGAIGRNNGDLDDAEAPCVLVVAELHQQLYTSAVAPYRAAFAAHKNGTQPMKPDEQAALLMSIYKELYVPPHMKDLKAIADIIIRQVRLGKP